MEASRVSDMEAIHVPLPKLLRPYRAAAIAEVLDVSRMTVSQWRNGRSVPEVRHLPALATFLKIDLGELTAAIAAQQDRERLRRARLAQ